MSLSGNALTGTVPARLAGISRLDVSHNQFLCGSLPVPPNATLLSQRTSIGQDCRSLNKQAARISGMTGVILGEHQHACFHKAQLVAVAARRSLHGSV
jgi:hypothetical protein